MVDLDLQRHEKEVAKRNYYRTLLTRRSAREVCHKLLEEYVQDNLLQFLAIPYAENTYDKVEMERANLQLSGKLLTDENFRKQIVSKIVEHGTQIGHIYFKPNLDPVDCVDFYMNYITKRLNAHQMILLAHRFDKEISMTKGQSR